MGHSSGGTLALSLAIKPSPPSVIASFYPILYVSDETSTAHQPYARFDAIPKFEPTQANIDAVFSLSDHQQLSSFHLPLPGTILQPRHKWLFTQQRTGNWIRAIQPDGNFKSIDPTVHFAEKGKVWPPTVFMQGDNDDLPGSGIALVERAVAELKAAGANHVRIERVKDASHGFDQAPGGGL